MADPVDVRTGLLRSMHVAETGDVYYECTLKLSAAEVLAFGYVLNLGLSRAEERTDQTMIDALKGLMDKVLMGCS
jgi:hypothetical protein